MNRIFMILKIKLPPGVYLSLSWGCIHVYVYNSKVYGYISQTSGERLQDHWSYGLFKVVLTWGKTIYNDV